MAVMRIKAYHTESSMHNGLNYSADPEKSALRDTNTVKTPDDIRLSHVFSYTSNPDKTHIGLDGDVDILVSGHHCNPDLAEVDFKRCRGLYYMNGHRENTGYAKARRPMRASLGADGKPLISEDGKMIYDDRAPVYKDPSTGKVIFQEYQKKKEARSAYMWVMSFPGKKELGYEIDPRLVHEIGKEFCREYLDEYACTISTHVNTDHCHNHIMQCAYSLDGTHKYRDTMEALAKARDISDRLSIRFGLPIILNPQTDRGVSWFEWKKKHDGQSWKQQIRMDIREAVGVAETPDDFCKLMEAMGYKVRETENHFTFTVPGAESSEAGYRCRDSRLNSSDDNFDYSKTGIQAAISQKHIQTAPTKPAFDPKHKGDFRHYANHIYISRYTIDGRRRTALEILIIEALKIITLLRDLFQTKEAPFDHPVYYPYQKKLRLMEDSLAMVQKLGLEDHKALSDLINRTGIELSQLKKQYNSSQPVIKQEKEILDKIDEAMELYGLIQNYGLTISDLELHQYEEKEVRTARSKLMPMTPAQRRELYLALSDSPVYRLKCKYEELTYQDAKEVIAFLKNTNGLQPDVIYNISDSPVKKPFPGRSPEETEKERQSQDTFFLSRLADYPMDKQMRLDRCRELLNELGQLGIRPDQLEASKKELKDSVENFADIENKMNEVSARYHSLKKLEHNLTLACNPSFTHGPLFDESKEKPVDKTYVDKVEQLRPEDRADEIKRRYELDRS